MSISYSGNFAKLLLRWKGSLWKAVWLETLIFLIAYYIINISYRVGMTGTTRTKFEALVLSMNGFMKVKKYMYVTSQNILEEILDFVLIRGIGLVRLDSKSRCPDSSDNF